MANSHRVLTIDTSRGKHEMGLRAEHLARFGGLLEEVRQTNRTTPTEPHGHRNGVVETLRLIGISVTEIGRDIIAVAAMLGAVAVALGRVAVRPHSFRFTSMVYHLGRVGWNAVPIILLIEPYPDERRYRQAHRFRVHQRHIAGNDAGTFELPKPAQAGRG